MIFFKKLTFFLLAVFLITSCKFNPSVTSNKRKYRKGHYKPLREDVAGNSVSNNETSYSDQNTQKKKHEPRENKTKTRSKTRAYEPEANTNPIHRDNIESEIEVKEDEKKLQKEQRKPQVKNGTVKNDSLANSNKESKFSHQANSIPKFTKIPLSFHIAGLLALIAGVLLVIYVSSAYLGLIIMALAALLGLGSTILSVIGLSIEKVRMHSITTILLHSIMILLFLVLMPLMILFVITTVY